jgi:oligoribonuclease (3'-5' exoribonuclease)
MDYYKKYIKYKNKYLNLKNSNIYTSSRNYDNLEQSSKLSEHSNKNNNIQQYGSGKIRLDNINSYIIQINYNRLLNEYKRALDTYNRICITQDFGPLNNSTLLNIVEPYDNFWIIKYNNDIVGYLKSQDLIQFKNDVPFFKKLGGEEHLKGLLISKICNGLSTKYEDVELLLLNKIEQFGIDNNYDYIVIYTTTDNKFLIGKDGLYTKKGYTNIEKFILKKYLNYKVIKKICCDTNTQWATRMAHCEDASHTAAAVVVGVYQKLGSYISNEPTNILDTNIDGIVKLSTIIKDIPIKYLFTENILYIGEDNNFISDHNGVNMIVNITNTHTQQLIKFNIITHNLEGLCNRNDETKNQRFEENKEKMTDYFRNYITSGTILLIQEMALQIDKRNIENQKRILESNTNIVLSKLTPLNENLKALSDEYTGAIIYDAVVWNLTRELRIARPESNKYSNAYLMKYREKEDLYIWVVNIHLKAFGATASSQAYINTKHIRELANIISKILEEPDSKYPIYFCGDYNNTTDKKELVLGALRQLYKGDIIDDSDKDSDDDFVDIEKDISNGASGTS